MAEEGRVGPNPLTAIAGLMEKLQRHSSVTRGTEHGPSSWSALWERPALPGGKPTRLPILVEIPDMADEDIDVQEACDAGVVDREDLVNEASKSACLLQAFS